MEDRFLFNAVVSSYYDIDTPENYEEFEPQIYLENVDLFSDEIGIDYDRLLDAVQKQLNLEKPEISQIMQYFEDNSNSNSEEYVTIKPDKILQCTGLKDKNGKLIYEGDVIKIPDDYATYGQFACEKREVYWNEGFRLKPKWDARARGNWLEDTKDFEVIGNIYENPELLED